MSHAPLGLFAKKRILISRLSVGCALPLLLIAGSGWGERFAWGVWVEEILFTLGVIAIALCVVGRIWCLAYIAGRKDGVLVTAGPYALCRNPLYFFSFLGLVGIGLCTETFTIPVLAGSVFLLAYQWTIRREEAFLSETFKEAYASYKASTPRFFPRFSGRADSADTLEIKLKPFRRGLSEVVWFVIIIALFAIIDELHDEGILPVLLTLY